jgi:hypothetical protein
MEDPATFLVNSLRHVIEGGDITGEQIDAAFPNGPKTLRGAQFKAYYGLGNWAADEDIREKDPSYAPMRRKGLVELLRRLEAENLKGKS